MNYNNNKAENIKIAYIGGGSRGWAWGLMSDLTSTEEISGNVYLYDIDYEAACHNEIIGNKFKECDGAKSVWTYHAAKTPEEAYIDADFVIISILPGTFDEMESDVHTPEKYGIYQSVGDTSGPGGIVRAMRMVPMYEEIAENIKKYCPNAWVINYTNPMTLCVKTLYRAFPQIKAFGCCHEVFGTQSLLMIALEEICGIKVENRNEIKVNPVSVNHFTWLTEAKYRNIDLFPVYREFAKKHAKEGFTESFDEGWLNSLFFCNHKVKFDLFNRYGYIAAAGDRHLAEFCEGKWYLKNPQSVKDWGFALTTVEWRKNDLKERLEKSEKYRNGELQLEIKGTGEEGVHQIKALLGLGDLVTNVNVPNKGQISNLPMGAVVETNAAFRSDMVTPINAGEIPQSIYPLVARICGEQEQLSEALAKRDVDGIFNVFAADPLVTCSYDDAKLLFKEMVMNTKDYLNSYDLSML
ncbi:MAG: alpha-glucosidase/alpha-galactosidase [Ruminococcaceae bacterium]|nr:alpha-glucosidase/alpha-galactosidase [Oscillospiraceae bacterium]